MEFLPSQTELLPHADLLRQFEQRESEISYNDTENDGMEQLVRRFGEDKYKDEDDEFLNELLYGGQITEGPISFTYLSDLKIPEIIIDEFPSLNEHDIRDVPHVDTNQYDLHIDDNSIDTSDITLTLDKPLRGILKGVRELVKNWIVANKSKNPVDEEIRRKMIDHGHSFMDKLNHSLNILDKNRSTTYMIPSAFPNYEKTYSNITECMNASLLLLNEIENGIADVIIFPQRDHIYNAIKTTEIQNVLQTFVVLASPHVSTLTIGDKCVNIVSDSKKLHPTRLSLEEEPDYIQKYPGSTKRKRDRKENSFNLPIKRLMTNFENVGGSGGKIVQFFPVVNVKTECKNGKFKSYEDRILTSIDPHYAFLLTNTSQTCSAMRNHIHLLVFLMGKSPVTWLLFVNFFHNIFLESYILHPDITTRCLTEYELNSLHKRINGGNPMLDYNDFDRIFPWLHEILHRLRYDKHYHEAWSIGLIFPFLDDRDARDLIKNFEPGVGVITFSSDLPSVPLVTFVSRSIVDGVKTDVMNQLAVYDSVASKNDLYRYLKGREELHSFLKIKGQYIPTSSDDQFIKMDLSFKTPILKQVEIFKKSGLKVEGCKKDSGSYLPF